MIKTLIKFTCATMLLTSACNNTEVNRSGGKKKPASDREHKTNQSTMRNTDPDQARTVSLIRQALQVLLEKDLKTMAPESRKFSFYEVDLNSDGSKEIFVALNGVGFCGSGGCSAYLLSATGEKINYFTVVNYPFEILKQKTHGWADLVVESNGLRLLKFNGKKYPSNPSVAPKFTGSSENSNPKALLITNDTPVFDF